MEVIIQPFGILAGTSICSFGVRLEGSVMCISALSLGQYMVLPARGPILSGPHEMLLAEHCAASFGKPLTVSHGLVFCRPFLIHLQTSALPSSIL